jgi:hypothetical protein
MKIQIMNKLSPENLRRNQSLLTFYFLYATLHGALRKWVFAGVSGVNDVLFMVQLILPFIIISAMHREKTILSCKPLLPYALILTGMALNPMNMTIYHGVFGFILHFGFWLMMLMYLQEPEAFPIENMVKLFVIVCFAETLLTFVQFGLPSSHFLNRYESASSDEVAGFENDGGVRVIGTFPYISGYGSLLFFIGLLIWALMVENKRSTLTILGLTAFGLLSAFMNGSRSIMVPFLVCVAFGFINYGDFTRKVKAFVTLFALVGLSFAFNLGQKATFATKAFDSFSRRVTYGQQSGEAESRTVGTFLEVIEFNGKYPLFGIGLGATYQGAVNKWGQSKEYLEYGYCEEEPERVVLEGGFILFTVRVLLFIILIFKLKVPVIYSIPIFLYIFFFTLFVFNTYQAAYVFLGFALLDKLYRNKQIEAA